MNIINVLRKLGILRFGAVGGTYKNYKDRPDELMYDNVYDKKKDLMSKEDYKKVAVVMKGKPSKILFIIGIIITAFLLLCLLLINGIHIYSIIGLILFILCIKLFKRFGVILYLALIIILLVLIVIATPSKSSSSTALCPDKELHSKTTTDGAIIYWKCGTKTYAKTGKPYDELIIQVVVNNADFPRNGKANSALSVNDMRQYCMTYSIKGKTTPEKNCSSFSDYSSLDPKNNALVIERFNADQQRISNPWFFPYPANSIFSSYGISLNGSVSRFEDIGQLTIYPFAMIDGKSDQDEASTKYQSVKTITLQ